MPKTKYKISRKRSFAAADRAGDRLCSMSRYERRELAEHARQISESSKLKWVNGFRAVLGFVDGPENAMRESWLMLARTRPNTEQWPKAI